MLSRLDLHIHTPASRCFSDEIDDYTCRRLVERAIEVGLDMVAATDHHSVEYVDKMRQAAQDTPLVVLPGVELSTRLGEIDEVYFLAIFPDHIPQKELRGFLKKLDVDSAHWGNCHYRVTQPLEIIIQEVKELGGLLISDHLDNPPQRCRAFPLLIKDYEIRIFDLKNADFAVEIEKLLPAGERAFCFTFSDAHGVEKMGKIYSEIDLPECSWKGLRQLLHA